MVKNSMRKPAIVCAIIFDMEKIATDIYSFRKLRDVRKLGISFSSEQRTITDAKIG